NASASLGSVSTGVYAVCCFGCRQIVRRHLLLPSRTGLLGACNPYPTQPLGIAGYTAIERFCNALAVLGGTQLALVGGIAHERDLRKDRGHIGADEHDEGSLLYPAIFHSGTLRRFSRV